MPSSCLALIAASLGAAIGCDSAADCNSHACVDCACTNRQCVCADGWSGANCSTPFCNDRPDCSNHGDCTATAKSIACSCDPGWQGPRCAAKACNVTCQHGGVPNPQCSACTGCLGAWSGPTCGVWNSSSVAPGALATRLEALRNKSASQLQASIQYNPICKVGQQCVGWGADLSVGSTSSYPLLELDFSGQQPSWRGFKYPAGVNVQGVDAPAFGVDTMAFGKLEQFADYVSGLWSSNQGRGGEYGTALQTVYDDQFQTDADASLVVSQATYPLYSMGLMPDSTSPSRYKLKLDPDALNALQGLGPYEEDKASWRTFFQSWGTDAILSSRGGGIVEYLQSPSTAMSNFTSTWLAAQGGCRFHKASGIGAPCERTSDDPIYDMYSTGASSFNCHGGEPSSCPSGNATNASGFGAWQQSLFSSPMLIDFVTTPISPFVEEPALKQLVDHAVAAYIDEQAKARPVTSCPTTCHGHGNCTAGASACTCSLPCFSGRQCSVINYGDPDEEYTLVASRHAGAEATAEVVEAAPVPTWLNDTAAAAAWLGDTPQCSGYGDSHVLGTLSCTGCPRKCGKGPERQTLDWRWCMTAPHSWTYKDCVTNTEGQVRACIYKAKPSSGGYWTYCGPWSATQSSYVGIDGGLTCTLREK